MSIVMRLVLCAFQWATIVLGYFWIEKYFRRHDYDAAAAFVFVVYLWLLSLAFIFSKVMGKDFRFIQTSCVLSTAVAIGAIGCVIVYSTPSNIAVLSFFAATVLVGILSVLFLALYSKKRGDIAYSGLNFKKTSLFAVALGVLVTAGVVLTPHVRMMYAAASMEEKIAAKIASEMEIIEGSAKQLPFNLLVKRFESLFAEVNDFVQRDGQVDMADLIEFVYAKADFDATMDVEFLFHNLTSQDPFPPKIKVDNLPRYYQSGFMVSSMKGELHTSPADHVLSVFKNGLPLGGDVYLFEMLEALGLQKVITFPNQELWTVVLTAQVPYNYTRLTFGEYIGFYAIDEQGKIQSDESYLDDLELERTLPNGAMVYQELKKKEARYVFWPLSKQPASAQPNLGVLYHYSPETIISSLLEKRLFNKSLIFVLMAVMAVLFAMAFWFCCRIEKLAEGTEQPSLSH